MRVVPAELQRRVWAALDWHSAQVVAPGFRLGWVTAAPAVIQKLVFQLHGISLGACSFTQARCRPAQ